MSDAVIEAFLTNPGHFIKLFRIGYGKKQKAASLKRNSHCFETFHPWISQIFLEVLSGNRWELRC